MEKSKSGFQRFWDRLAGRSSSTSEAIQNQDYTYDVFISFRGRDARNSFVDHLSSHLHRKGIFVFKDDKLQKGESISPQLLQAIQHSHLSIIVFSKNYASSTWCLDEMAAIASRKQLSNHTVFPIFYDVDPSCKTSEWGIRERLSFTQIKIHTRSGQGSRMGEGYDRFGQFSWLGCQGQVSIKYSYSPLSS